MDITRNRFNRWIDRIQGWYPVCMKSYPKYPRIFFLMS